MLAALADADIAHFACHAANDPAEPSRSTLILHDHDTNPLTISSLAPVQLDRVQLAYLSACQTSRSASDGLTDESIHLSSVFQLVGYPHVTGTLWQIVDRFAADIADDFYSQLQKTFRPFATDAAAKTLRDVIRSKRDAYPDDPLLWGRPHPCSGMTEVEISLRTRPDPVIEPRRGLPATGMSDRRTTLLPGSPVNRKCRLFIVDDPIGVSSSQLAIGLVSIPIHGGPPFGAVTTGTACRSGRGA